MQRTPRKLPEIIPFCQKCGGNSWELINENEWKCLECGEIEEIKENDHED